MAKSITESTTQGTADGRARAAAEAGPPDTPRAAEPASGPSDGRSGETPSGAGSRADAGEGGEAAPGTERLSAALTEALARRLRLGDLSHGGGLKHDTLKRRVLSGYRTTLDGAPDGEVLVWLLDRLAGIEAQVIALQQAHAAAEARPATPAPARSARKPAAARAGGPASAPAPTPPPAAAPPRPALPRRVIAPCDDALVHKGFYEAERSPQGRSFRWIGPEPRATLFLPRVEAPVEVRLHLYGAFVREAIPLVKVSLDKGAWAAVTVTQDREGIVLTARPVSGDPGTAPVSRLDIDAAVSDSPANRGEADDRVLSIALSAVEAVSVAG